jgi:uncharacterized protein (DUF2342 family)
VNEPDPAERHARLRHAAKRRRAQAGPLEYELARVARLERIELERVYREHDRELWAEVARLEREAELEAFAELLAGVGRLEDELELDHGS